MPTRGANLGEQPACLCIASPGARLHQGAMSELAARARLFAVVVQMDPRLLQNRRPGGHAADEVDHGAEAPGPRGAQRQPENAAQVVLELTGLCALDGPVAGVVHAGCHLVGDESPTTHEELDGGDSGVAEMGDYPLQVAGCKCVPARRAKRRAREAQHPLRMNISVQGVDDKLAVTAASPDDRDFTVKRHVLLIEQGHVSQLIPRTLRILGCAYYRLALAVIAHATRLDDAGQPDVT